MIRNKEPNSAVKDSNINHQVEENIQGKTLDKEKPESHQEEWYHSD